jgi:thiosulfate dehydrogenase [quinone] large subunit
MRGYKDMPEARRQAEPQNSGALLDQRLTYLLLRLTLGINILLHGVVRLPALGAFAEGTVQQFADTPLPAVAVRLFGLLLPFLETAIGLLLTIGLWTRWALVASGLLIAALVFGTALRNDWETLSIQMLYAIIYYLLLAGRTSDYFALDTLCTKRLGRSKSAFT